MLVFRGMLAVGIGLGLSSFVAPGDALAGISASASAPIRAGIDAACHPAAAAAAASAPPSGYRVVMVERTSKAPNAYGPWKVTTAIANMKLQTSASFIGADFVQAVFSGDALAYVSETFTDASGDGATVDHYCYRANRRARVNVNVSDLSVDAAYARVAYFDETGALLSDSGVQARRLTTNAPEPRDYANVIPLPVYRTAQREPFYAALQTALVHSR